MTEAKDPEERRLLDAAQLLTAKPVLYVCNVGEDEAADGNAHSARVFAKAAAEGQRQPVQVVEGNYEVGVGTCAWWDGVRRGQ